MSGCRVVCGGAQDVLYGVFNDDWDDGQAGQGGGGAGMGKRAKDFKTPVAFVSSGVQGSAAPQEDGMDVDVDEDDPFSRPKGLGLGASVNPLSTAAPSESHRQPNPSPAPPGVQRLASLVAHASWPAWRVGAAHDLCMHTGGRVAHMICDVAAVRAHAESSGCVPMCVCV